MQGQIDIKSFFVKLLEASSLSGRDTYSSLKDLGIALCLFYGRLEIVKLRRIDEQKLSIGQKEMFFKILSQKAGELKEEYCRQNPEYRDVEVSMPYLKDGKELVIPHDCHAKYRYWLQDTNSSWKHLEKSQPLRDTLLELNVSENIMIRYVGKTIC